MKRTWLGCLVVVLVTGAIGRSFGQSPTAAAADDPFVGTWRLDSAKSTFKPTVYNRGVMAIEPVCDQFKTSVDTQLAGGILVQYEFVAKTDGRDYPLPGMVNADTVSIRRIDARTLERTHKKRTKVDTVFVSRVSADGMTMEVSQKGFNPRGEPVDNLLIYRKDPDTRPPTR